MLEIELESRELWDESSETFIKTRPSVLKLEHSLISISKWESKWHKPFLSRTEKTPEEANDYIRCMSVAGEITDEQLVMLTRKDIQRINDYVSDSMTASTVKKEKHGNNGEAITSELIYYWMVALEIPFECQKWHLNRLLMLIEICNAKNKPGKKMPKAEQARRNHSLNAARRAKYNTRG